MRLAITNPESNDTLSNMRLNLRSDLQSYVIIPTVPDDISSGNVVPTIDYCNSNFLKSSGSTSSYTSNNYHTINLVCTKLDSDNPDDPDNSWSSNGIQKWNEHGINILDKNNTIIGTYRSGMEDTGKFYSFIRVQNPTHSEDNKYYQISITADKDGNAATSCPDPKSDSNTNEIATTSWVRNLLRSAGVNV